MVVDLCTGPRRSRTHNLRNRPATAGHRRKLSRRPQQESHACLCHHHLGRERSAVDAAPDVQQAPGPPTRAMVNRIIHEFAEKCAKTAFRAFARSLRVCASSRLARGIRLPGKRAKAIGTRQRSLYPCGSKSNLRGLRPGSAYGIRTRMFYREKMPI
jgi:hypothetical protein